MNSPVVERMIRRLNVLMEGHFILTSGLHSALYFNKDRLYTSPEDTARCAQRMSWAFEADNVSLVAAPAIGAIILGHRVAEDLAFMNHTTVASIYADQQDGRLLFKRGYDTFLTATSRVLIVEDVITTSKSVSQVINLVRAAGAIVVGVAALCNRGSITAEQLGVPKLEALITRTAESWSPIDCPLCKAEQPINTNVGKGREYLAHTTRP